MSPKRSGESDRHRTFTRRGLLGLSAVGLGTTLAGCNGASPTDTAVQNEARASPTPTASATATRTPSATALLGRSPSSHVGPGDGFADLSWLTETTPRVLRVTTLDSSGEGSLRWALDQQGPRVVVFEVGGVVDLTERHLSVENGKVWVAGQTAPSPGITIVRGGLFLDADDCFVQHLRVRPGDAGNDSDWAPDAINTGNGSRNNVIDHCSATWSVDEALTVGYRTLNTTVTNCLIAEALNDASHPKGEHGYGSLVGNGARKVTLAGNLWAHNTARNPRLKAETRSVVANNVMYHFEQAVNLDDSTIAAVHGNAFLRGDGPFVDGGRASVADNYTDTGESIVGNVDLIGMKPFWPADLQTVPAEQVTERVLESVGARPADRTAPDAHVLVTVQAGTGRYVDSQSEVGGYPDQEATERSLDVPDSGLVRWLHQHAKAVELPDASAP